jgi:hypothetical protein
MQRRSYEALAVGNVRPLEIPRMKNCIRCHRPLTTKTLGYCEPGVGPIHKRCGPNADLHQWEARSCME